MSSPDPGLCGQCAYARRQRSARGGEFLRCGRADEDPAYRRYPPLPVEACAGFTAEPGASAASNPAGPKRSPQARR